MQIQVVTVYKIDGKAFDSIDKAKKHVEERIFKHVANALTDSLRGLEDCWGAPIAQSEKTKMKLAVMQYILDNKEDIADLLSADFAVDSDDE